MSSTTPGNLNALPIRTSGSIGITAPDGHTHAWRAVMAFFIFALVLVFGMSMSKDLDVDESPFIASGALMARHGDIPYRDYHYNHMPTEVIIYAGLFRLTDHLLLIARAFQALCAAGLATVLFATAYGAASQFKRRGRLLFAWGIGLLLLTNPLFTRTAGISWNHDFPMLMAMLGFLALRRGLNHGPTALLTMVSGFLVAIAATSRLTFLPITAGFVLLILLHPGARSVRGDDEQKVRPYPWHGLPARDPAEGSRANGRRMVLLIALFSIGFLLACLPSLWIWSQAWRNAFFGNFLYPKLNTAIHLRRDKHPDTTFFPILGWYLKSWFSMPGNGIVTIAFGVLIARRLRPRRTRHHALQAELLSISMIAALLLASGFMPAPPYPQYFYGPTPFMILGIALCLASSGTLSRDQKAWRIPAAGLAVCVLAGSIAYGHVYWLATPKRWTPMQVHAIGRRLADKLGGGYVLTLEPVFPLEGGLDVNPWFTTGRFGLRAANLLSAAEKRQYLMPAAADIGRLFDTNPPGSVLIVRGSDATGERAFVQAARAHGYRSLALSLRSGGHKHPFVQAWVRAKSR